MNCPKCNSELEAGVKFCEHCGASIPEAAAAAAPAAPATIFCTNCGTKTSAESAFCENCGARIDGAAAPVAPAAAAAAAAAAPAAPKPEKKPFKFTDIPKKWRVIGIAGLAGLLVLIAAIVIIVTIVGNNARKNYAVYMKDHELVFLGIGKDTKKTLTDDLKGDLDRDTVANRGAALAQAVRMTKDNTRLFYISELEIDGTATLYYLDVYEKGKPKEVDKVDYRNFVVNKDGTKVIFERDGDLYEHNLKDREKIASDVSGWIASKDCKRVVYMNDDGDIYEKASGKDKEKIDSEIESVAWISDDCKTVVYTKDGNLYAKKTGKDKQKIASEVYDVVEAYSSSSIYYTVLSEVEIKLSDYLDDDMKDSDAALTKPVYPNYSDPTTFSATYTEWPTYPSWNDPEYDTKLQQYNDIRAALDVEYDKAVVKYREDYDLYDEKVDREDIRENIDDYNYTENRYSPYYYDGKNATLLTENYARFDEAAYDKAVMAFEEISSGTAAKVKISEVESLYSLRNMVEEALEGSTGLCVAVGKNVTRLEDVEGMDLGYLEMDPDGKSMYCMVELNYDECTAELYRLTISGDKVGKFEKYDEDVYYNNAWYVAGGKFIYFKDYDSEKQDGELYMDKKLIDSDVNSNNIVYSEDMKALLYYKDVNSEKDYGTLCISKNGGKGKKIADDVHTIGYTSKGELLYLKDYSTSSYSGELYLYTDGKSKKIDSDVNAILSMN